MMSVSSMGVVDFRSDKERTASYTKAAMKEAKKQTELQRQHAAHQAQHLHLAQRDATHPAHQTAVEQGEFSVMLLAAGVRTIQVIKEVRALTSLGLKEAKDLVEAAPVAVLEKVTKDTAEKARVVLERAGAAVTVSAAPVPPVEAVPSTRAPWTNWASSPSSEPPASCPSRSSTTRRPGFSALSSQVRSTGQASWSSA
jgi:ribosomal protein L7/L12